MSHYIHSNMMRPLGIDYSPRLNVDHGCDFSELFYLSVPIGLFAVSSGKQGAVSRGR